MTTKKGKAGKVQVDFDAYYGWQNPNTNGVTPLGAKEYMEIIDSNNGRLLAKAAGG